MLLDGVENAGGELALDTDHTLAIGAHLFALHGSSDAQKWLRGMSHSEWFIFNQAESQKYGPLDFSALANALERFPHGLESVIVLCRGLTTMGFYAEQVLPLLPRSAPATSQRDVSSHDAPEPAPIDTEYGEFTCPVCWLKFDRGDTMNIAVHASLRGDPVLGEEHLQRFHATRFNDRG